MKELAILDNEYFVIWNMSFNMMHQLRISKDETYLNIRWRVLGCLKWILSNAIWNKPNRFGQKIDRKGNHIK